MRYTFRSRNPANPDASSASSSNPALSAGEGWWIRLGPALILGFLFLLALFLGALDRWAILAERPLAVDEYYMAQSVDFIFARGLPEFPAGGYYDRAWPLQYLMAVSSLLFGGNEFSLRLPSFAFSLSSIVLAWLYARRFVSPILSLTLVIVLLISSWSIEFAGFARMYALLQCAILIFLIALDDAFFSGAWQRRYLPHLILVLTVPIHAIAVLLSPLLFLPLIAGGPPGGWRGLAAWLRFAAVGLATAVVSYGYQQIGFRDLGVTTPNILSGYQSTVGGAGVNPPAFPFWELEGDPWTTLALLGGMLIIGVGIARLVEAHRGEVPGSAIDLWFVALLLASLAHLFVPMTLILGLLILRYDLLQPAAHPRWRHVVVVLALLIAVGWLVYALTGPAALSGPEIDHKWDLSRYGLAKALWTTFLGWPDFLRTTLIPFAQEMPLIGCMAAVSILALVILNRHRPLAELVRQPWVIVVYTMLVFGLFEPPGASELRYWFHLQPVVLLVILMAIAQISRRLAPNLRQARIDVVAAFVFLGAFALSSDFNPAHLVWPRDPNVAYRQGAFANSEQTWYSRFDYLSPANFVNRNASSHERVVVEYHYPSSYYLDIDYAIYLPRQTLVFVQHSQQKSTIDRWSGHPLLSSPDELQAYVADTQTVWWIRGVKRRENFPQLPDLETAFGPRLRSAERVHLSEDGRIEVLRVQLIPPPNAGS